MVNNQTKAAPKPLTKNQLKQKIADLTGLAAKDVGAVLDKLADICASELSRNGVGTFTLPGIAKVFKVHKPAVKGGKQVKNPFKPGEMMITKDRPAKNIVRIRPVKALKDAVQ